MQRSDAWELSPHEVCLPCSQLREQASEPGTTYPSKVKNQPSCHPPHTLALAYPSSETASQMDLESRMHLSVAVCLVSGTSQIGGRSS
jgi:hypothetical protein